MPPKPPAARTKLVVRNLPPSLAEDAALDTLHAIIPSEAYNYVAFFPGKLSSNRIRPARLYINLCQAADVVRVASALHNKLFVSERGAQFRAAVEFAPNQRIPRQAKPDKRPGTLDTDADYLAFCEQLDTEQGDAGLPDPPSSASEGPIITPLMQALIAKHTPAAKPRGKKGGAPGASKPSKGGAPPQQAQQGQKQGRTAAAKKPAAASTSQGPAKVLVVTKQKAAGSAGQEPGAPVQPKGGRPAKHTAPSRKGGSSASEAGIEEPKPTTSAALKTTSAASSEGQRGQPRVREGFQVYRPKPRKG